MSEKSQTTLQDGQIVIPSSSPGKADSSVNFSASVDFKHNQTLSYISPIPEGGENSKLNSKI